LSDAFDAMTQRPSVAPVRTHTLGRAKVAQRGP